MNSRKGIALFNTLLLFLICVAGAYIYFYEDVTSINLDNRFSPPDLNHFAGTDDLGRDLLYRTTQGAALSLALALTAWIVSFVIGLISGAVAGYYKGRFPDIIISSLITYAYATPFIIFLIALLGLIGPGLVNAYLILVLFAWAAPARHARAIIAGMKDSDYVKASLSFGYRTPQMIGFVIVPQVIKPVLIASLAVLPEVIALDAVLAFFGLGVQPPTPSLGKMIVDGMNYMATSWWMVTIPVVALIGLCLIIRKIATNLYSLQT